MAAAGVEDVVVNCSYCEKQVRRVDTVLIYDVGLSCLPCVEKLWDNKTGYCSAACCMGGGCDGSC